MRITERAHEAVRAVVRPGDAAIDATLGNGFDALFLARCVGPQGTVYGFDVQAAALAATERRLHEAGSGMGNVHLIHAGHEEMMNYVGGPVAAVMFNLGYLPGGDRALISRAATTTTALDEALRLLAPDGLISVVCYRGHPGGAEEGEAVLSWAERTAGVQSDVIGLEATTSAPFLVLLRRRA